MTVKVLTRPKQRVLHLGQLRGDRLALGMEARDLLLSRLGTRRAALDAAIRLGDLLLLGFFATDQLGELFPELALTVEALLLPRFREPALVLQRDFLLAEAVPFAGQRVAALLHPELLLLMLADGRL